MPVDPTMSTLQRLAQRRPVVPQPLAEIQRSPMQSNDPSLLYDMRNAVSAGPSLQNGALQQTAVPDPYQPYSPITQMEGQNPVAPYYSDQPNAYGGSAQQNAYERHVPQNKQSPLATLASEGNPTLNLLREFEGFREKPYWDVNAYRTGYGSDTVTRADGSVVPVRKGMRVSRKDADRDLARRAPVFANTARKQVGADAWRGLSPNQRAVMTSIAYNYGSLPGSVVKSMTRGGDVAGSIRALARHNKGTNASRRMREAAIFAAG